MYALEAFAGFAAALAIAAAVLIWLIFSGPVSLGPFRDQVERALTNTLPSGYGAEIGGLTLAWDRDDRVLAVVASDVDVRDTGGGVAASAPEAKLAFSLRALATGRLAPSRIELRGADIRVVRRQDGRAAVGVETGAQSPPAPRALGFSTSDLLRRLLLPAEDSRSQRLEEVRLSDARVTFMDEGRGAAVTAEKGAFVFKRRPSGADVEFDVRFDVDGATGALSGAGAFSKISRSAFVDVKLKNLPLADVALRLLDPDSPLGLSSPVSGRASLNFSEDGALLAADADLVVAPGRAVTGDADSLAVEGGRFRGAYDPLDEALLIDAASLATEAASIAGLQGRVRIEPGRASQPPIVGFDLAAETIDLDLVGVLPEPVTIDDWRGEGRFDIAHSTLTISDGAARVFQSSLEGAFEIAAGPASSVDGARLSPAVKADLTASGPVSPKDVLRLWPVDFILGARDWIEGYLIGATLRDVAFVMDVPAGSISEHRRVLDDQMRLTFAFTDGHVNYFPGLTHLTELRGDAILTGDRFHVGAAGGKVGELDLLQGEVDMPQLVPRGSPAYFRGRGSGDTELILKLLDQKPLQFVSKLGLQTDDIGGTSAVSFEFSRPLLRNVPLADVGYSAEAEISEFSAAEMITGAPISDGEMQLSLKRDGIVMNGDMTLGGLPVTVAWKETFFADGPSTELELRGEIDAATRDAFGFATRSFLNGPVAFEATARGNGSDLSVAEIRTDFEKAELDVSRIGWLKPRGAPASADFLVSWGDDGAVLLERVEMTGEDVSVKGSAALSPDGRLLSADLERLYVSRTADFALKASRDEETGGLRIDLNGSLLNAAPVLGDAFTPAGGSMDWGAGVSFYGELDRLRLLGGLEAEGVRLSFGHDGSQVQYAELTGRMPAGGPVVAKLRQSARAEGGREMAVRAQDAGQVMMGLFGLNSFRDGALALDAWIDDAPSGAGALSGQLRVEEFKVVNAPALAKLLGATSLSGLAQVLNGEGIAFDKLSADFTMSDDTLVMEEARAVGSAIGVSASGPIDFGADKMAINGALAPAYSINSAFGAAPVVGGIFAPREGEGLFGVTFSMTGPVDEPTIYVNPLSAFAPGFLRRIFEPTPDAATAEDQPSAAPVAPL